MPDIDKDYDWVKYNVVGNTWERKKRSEHRMQRDSRLWKCYKEDVPACYARLEELCFELETMVKAAKTAYKEEEEKPDKSTIKLTEMLLRKMNELTGNMSGEINPVIIELDLNSRG